MSESTRDTGGAFAAMSDAIAHRDTGAASELRDQIAEEPGGPVDWQTIAGDRERLAKRYGEQARIEHDRAERAEAAIERATEALTNALLEWQPEYDYRLDRARRKGYSHDEIAVGTLGDAIKVASAVLAALGQPPAEPTGKPEIVGLRCVSAEKRVPHARHGWKWGPVERGCPGVGQPPAEEETKDPERCGYVRVRWDGPYRTADRCTAPAGHSESRFASYHGPWESAGDAPDDTEVVSVRPGEPPREITDTHLPEG